jgi:hypothetical protein
MQTETTTKKRAMEAGREENKTRIDTHTHTHTTEDEREREDEFITVERRESRMSHAGARAREKDHLSRS